MCAHTHAHTSEQVRDYHSKPEDQGRLDLCSVILRVQLFRKREAAATHRSSWKRKFSSSPQSRGEQGGWYRNFHVFRSPQLISTL